MKVCIVSSQITNYGKIGGFGSMTRQIAEALHSRGIEVSVVVPKILDQPDFVDEDGIKIYGIPRKDFLKKEIFQMIDADVYHSQNPNFLTYMAQVSQPNKKHVITCRDPRDLKDWLIEIRYATPMRRFKNVLAYIFEESFFVQKAIRNADRVGVPAQFLRKKVERMYKRPNIDFFPNIETFPTEFPEKSEKPSVVYIGRLDKRKRPELVLNIASKLPNVTFHIVGRAEDPTYQAFLEEEMKKRDNIVYHGYINKHGEAEKLNTIYKQSWMLLNTAAREGLPMTFIEAVGHGCAIVSEVDPDEFASKFGYHAEGEDQLADGISDLIEENRWKEKALPGYEYVMSVYSQKSATDFHIDLYKELLEQQ